MCNMSNIFFEKKHDCVVKSRDLVDYYGKLCIFADKYKANMNIESNMKEVCNYLHTIERTRLLRNTLKELELLVGFSVSNGNGLTRKGGKSLFVKDAIFRELAHIANKETGLNLQDVIDTYIETDRMLDRLGKIKDAPQTCKHLIWYFYENGEATEDIANILNSIENRHAPFIILMLMNALPRLTAKGGDVKDISRDYHNIMSLLEQSVNKGLRLKKLPMLSLLEDSIRKNPKIMNRLHLISITNAILNSYGALSTRERMSNSNKIIAENMFFPDIDGIWTEGKAATEFWKIERIANGYNLYKYSLYKERKELKFTKYFLKIFHCEDGYRAIVIHPHAIQSLVGNTPLPNNMYANFKCEVSNEVISFEPFTTESKWMKLSVLRRDAATEYFSKVLHDDLFRHSDCHPEDAYSFNLSLVAITNNDLYIKKGVNEYYKVPKSMHTLLSDVGFKSNVGIITFLNKPQHNEYIAFDDFNLYYDVSNDEKINCLGIAITNEITE